jgi:hypothetical protein
VHLYSTNLKLKNQNYNKFHNVTKQKSIRAVLVLGKDVSSPKKELKNGEKRREEKKKKGKAYIICAVKFAVFPKGCCVGHIFHVFWERCRFFLE